MSILWILCALCGSHIRGFWWPRYAQIVAFYGSNCTIRKAAIHCQSGWFDRCIICPAGRWIWLGMELKGRQGILCSQMHHESYWIMMLYCCIAMYEWIPAWRTPTAWDMSAEAMVMTPYPQLPLGIWHMYGIYGDGKGCSRLCQALRWT